MKSYTYQYRVVSTLQRKFYISVLWTHREPLKIHTQIWYFIVASKHFLFERYIVVLRRWIWAQILIFPHHKLKFSQIFGSIVMILLTAKVCQPSKYLHYGVDEKCDNPKSVHWHQQTHASAFLIGLLHGTGTHWRTHSWNRPWLH